MIKIKDVEVRNLKDGNNKVVSLGKGNGAIVFRRMGNTCTGFYRYWKGKQSIFLKLGVYRQTQKSPGMKLSELTDKALEMVALRKQVAPIDLKQYLQNEKNKVLDEAKQQEAEKAEACHTGTFEDLLMAYARSLEDRGATSAYNVTTMFETNLLDPYPELAAKSAADVTSEDLMPVLTQIIQRNSPGQYNGVRSYLSAAFNFGVRADFDPKENAKTGKRYRIKFNPVTPFPKEAVKPRKRVLSHSELSQLWRDIDDGVFDSIPQYGLFVQFCIACFGNRPVQLSRVKWSDIEMDNRTLTFLDVKGRGNPRLTTIPLTDRAMNILKTLRALPDNYRFNGKHCIPMEEQTVFKNESGEPLGYDSIYHKVNRYTRFCEFLDRRDAQTAGREYHKVEHWTMKDFRRTAVGIMTDARIIRESRYLLQSRTDGSVESRHYDVSERMDEKWEAALKYDAMLEKILKSETVDRHCTTASVFNETVLSNYQAFKQRIMDDGEVMTQKYYMRNGYKETTIRRWFEQLVMDGVIRKQHERFYYVDPSVTDDTRGELTGTDEGYRLFRQQVLDSGELKQLKQYIKEGYSDKKIRRWFRRLTAEGVIHKVRRFYYLKEAPHAQTQT